MTSPESYVEPDLTDAQYAMYLLTGEILDLRPPGHDLTYWDIPSSVDANEVYTQLKDTVAGELFIPHEDSLSDADYDTSIFAVDGTLKAVGVRAFEWEYDKRRRDPAGPSTHPYEMIEFPGEQDWIRELNIMLDFSDDKRRGRVILRASTSSYAPGETPSLSSDTCLTLDGETGGKEHNQKHLETVSEDDVLCFVGLSRLIFNNRETDK